MRRSPLLPLLLLPLALVLAPNAPHGWGLGPSLARADDGDPPKPPAGPDDDPFADDPNDSFLGPTSFTAEQVDKAIEKGVAYLRKQQNINGSWGEITGGVPYGGGQAQGSMYTHPAGPTALALYTLLKCKVPAKDGSITKGFGFLKDNYRKPAGSYETSMLLLAICATGNPYKTRTASNRNVERLRLSSAFRGWALELVDHLVGKMVGDGWRYNITGQESQGGPEGFNQDLSSTQLAALALFAANQVHVKTKDAIWESILKFSLSQQEESGPDVVEKDPITHAETHHHARGFAYTKGAASPDEGQATGSMTACGIANLMMARFVLTDGGRKQDAWDQRPDAAKVQEAVEDGLAWIAENWSNYTNPHKHQGNVYHLYWLYAVERAMDLIDKQKIGTHLWYSDMGQQLLDHQRDDGSWNTGSTHNPQDVLDTCFALLFLKRATKGQIPFPSITGGSDEPPVDGR
jgi:Prenyltransferase and squalene oxidase repeat